MMQQITQAFRCRHPTFIKATQHSAMAEIALPGSIEPAKQHGPKLDRDVNPITAILFMGVLAAGILFVAYSIYSDIDATGTKISNYVPFLLLFVALLIALGFEFVNGFHDTANAVATVIYTHSLPANVAVVLVGRVELVGCSLVIGRRGFRHRIAAARGINPSSWQQRRLCHGICIVDRGDHLEPGDLVIWPASFEFAYPDRLGHRRRHRQRLSARP